MTHSAIVVALAVFDKVAQRAGSQLGLDVGNNGDSDGDDMTELVLEFFVCVCPKLKLIYVNI